MLSSLLQSHPDTFLTEKPLFGRVAQKELWKRILLEAADTPAKLVKSRFQWQREPNSNQECWRWICSKRQDWKGRLVSQWWKAKRKTTCNKECWLKLICSPSAFGTNKDLFMWKIVERYMNMWNCALWVQQKLGTTLRVVGGCCSQNCSYCYWLLSWKILKLSVAFPSGKPVMCKDDLWPNLTFDLKKYQEVVKIGPVEALNGLKSNGLTIFEYCITECEWSVYEM